VKFDKVTIVGFAVCIILLFAWEPICRYLGWINPPKPQLTVQTVPSAPAGVAATSAVAAAGKNDKTPATPATELRRFAPMTFQNDDVKVVIDVNSGAVEEIQLKKFFNSDRNSFVTFKDSFAPGTLVLGGLSDWKVVAVTPKTEADGLSVSRVLVNGDRKLELVQNWRSTSNYQLDYGFSLKNLSGETIRLDDLRLMTGALAPVDFQTGDLIRSEVHNLDYFTTKLFSISASAKDEKFNIKVDAPVKWLGASNKYFACLIRPVQPTPEFTGMDPVRRKEIGKIKGEEKEYYTVAAEGKYGMVDLAAGQVWSCKYVYYTGPKELKLLDKFDPESRSIMHLSFLAPMEWISRQLLTFLIWLKGFCGSYGWSIIILTIIVRLIFWPITQKANNSMKKMQKLQPMIQELKEKYKNDQQQLNLKMMELYREQKINPLGGCLPILLQIPVFIALYSTIDSAVELRHTSFMWAYDLAQPDTVAVLFGSLPIHPLVIIMTILMVVQQKMTPAAADPMQQKIMMLMPVVMLFVLYSLPAGLTLYWTVSQIFSIIQLLVTRKNGKDATPVKNS